MKDISDSCDSRIVDMRLSFKSSSSSKFRSVNLREISFLSSAIEVGNDLSFLIFPPKLTFINNYTI